MELRDRILSEHSRKNTDAIVNWVGSSRERFDELFALFTGDHLRTSQIASWAMSYCVRAHPFLIDRHWKGLLANLAKPGIHNAMVRNSLRLMEHIEIPTAFHGEVMTRCFDRITNPKELPAIKAFALTILDNLVDTYPEIREELISIIDNQWDQESPAFQSRARKLLKKYGKERQ